MKLQVTEVIQPLQIQQFLDFPEKIYAHDPNYIRPLDQDVEAVFNPEKNKFFKTGTCKRWLFRNEQGELVGRVATFVTPKYKQEQPTGGFGFFEVIEQKEAAFFILDFCRDWLKEKGMEAMDGPINFGERDKFWGLVVEGYYEPLYGMNYNPPYYKTFFEEYGFKVYFYQECYGMKVAYNLQEKFFARADEIRAMGNIHAEHFYKRNWEKYARDFAKVYNLAWVQHGEGKSLDERVAVKMFKSMKAVIDERIVWFVYEGEEPVACWINIPDLNQWFKYLNGKFGWLQKLRFLWLKQFKHNKRFVGIVFGVVPKWQGKGMDSFIIVEGGKVITDDSHYEEYEMQWIGDFNPKMTNVAKHLGAHISRKLATYRYLFDRTKEFKRHPIL